MEFTTKEKFFAGVTIIAIVFSLYSWFKPIPVPPTPPVVKPPTIADPVIPDTINSKPTTTTKKCKDLVVYTQVTNTVYINDTTNKKDEEVVIATGIVPSWVGNTNVYAYYNELTAKSRISYAQQPILPKDPEKKNFFEFTDIKSLGAYYGYGSNGTAIMLEGNWDIVRTGAIHWELRTIGLIYDDKFTPFLFAGGKYTWR